MRNQDVKGRSLILFIVLLIPALGLIQAQTEELFNGKDLSGWTIYGTEKWYVEDGLLICESGADKEYGYLGTEREFKNFELNLEFKQGADGNSGVFFRSSIEGTKIAGWQAEVAPPGSYTGGIYESYGRGWLIKPDPEKDKALKFGDWNRMRIRVVDNQVTTWLNGQEMVSLMDEKIGGATGIIALQIHSGGGIKVYWRNITIQTLAIHAGSISQNNLQSRKYETFKKPENYYDITGGLDYFRR